MRFPHFDQEQAGLSPQSEATEMELAAELLGVSSEQEMEQFLGGLLSRAVSGVANFARTPAGQQLIGLLKSTAKQALPGLGGAIGHQLGGAAGAKLGNQLASGAGRLLGLELEGLSNEDREFETSRQLIRLIQDAANRLDAQDLSPRQARSAYVQAAREHAPGVWGEVPAKRPSPSRRPPQRSSSNFPASGVWQRQGDAVVLS